MYFISLVHISKGESVAVSDIFNYIIWKKRIKLNIVITIVETQIYSKLFDVLWVGL